MSCVLPVGGVFGVVLPSGFGVCGVPLDAGVGKAGVAGVSGVGGASLPIENIIDFFPLEILRISSH